MEDRAVRLLKALLAGKQVTDPGTGHTYKIWLGQLWVVAQRYSAETVDGKRRHTSDTQLLGAEHMTVDMFLEWADTLTEDELTALEQGN